MATRINVHELYLDTLDIIGIDARGQLKIDQFNRYMNTAIREFIDFLTGRLSEAPEPSLQMFRVQKQVDVMAPIITRFMQPYSAGLVPYPPAYDHLLDIRISRQADWKPGDCGDMPQKSIDEILNGRGGFRTLDVLSHDEIPSRVNSFIPRLATRPCCEQYSDGFLIHVGEDSGSAFVVYVREPEVAHLAMTMDEATGRLIYNPATSVDPPFTKKVQKALALQIAQYHFNNTREEGAIGTSQAVSKT